MNRRDFVSVLGATAMIKQVAFAVIAQTAMSSLKELASHKGIMFG